MAAGCATAPAGAPPAVTAVAAQPARWAVREPVAPERVAPERVAPERAAPPRVARKPAAAKLVAVKRPVVRRARQPFATPEAAMRHLAAAYNARSIDALKQLTTPEVRRSLLDMAEGSPDLRLEACHRNDAGYGCVFSHGYPAGDSRGEAFLAVLPSARTGWYAASFDGCG